MSEQDVIAFMEFLFDRYAAGHTPTQQQIKYALQDWENGDR